MADLKINNVTGDIDITANVLSLTSGSDAIRQHLLIRYQFFLGEWFLDTRLGVPYFQSILGKGNSESLIRAILRDVSLTTPGVLEILEFAFTLTTATRTLSVDAKLRVTGDEVINFGEEFIVSV